MDALPRLQTADRLPLTCGKCHHSDQVSIKDDEIHCHFCGNFAIVGMKARFPFEKEKGLVLVGVGRIRRPDSEVIVYPTSAEMFSGPMQVGESLETKKENPPFLPSQLPKCKVDGCTKVGGIKGFCADHFHKEYGISYDTYLRHRKDKDEDPKAVAARWRSPQRT